MSGGLSSVARRRDAALRLRFARRCSLPSTPLSPVADHRPKPRDKLEEWLFPNFGKCNLHTGNIR